MFILIFKILNIINISWGLGTLQASTPSSAKFSVQVILLRKGFERSHILVPIINDIGNLQRLAKVDANIVRPTDEVEHPRAALRQLEGILPEELPYRLHHIELNERKRRGVVVAEIKLHTVYEFALKRAEHWLEVDGAEVCAGNGIAVQTLLKLLGINPFRSKNLEGQSVSDTNVKVLGGIEFATDSGYRIVYGRTAGGDVRRRQNPRQAGVGINHVARPSFHWDHGKLAFERLFGAALAYVEPFLVDKHGQLPYRKAVDVGNGEFAHERVEARLYDAALHFVATQRVRPVQHHHFYALFGAGAHHKAQGADEGIAARADVLDVVHHYIDACKHFCRWFPVLAVDGKDRHSCRRVRCVFDLGSGVGVASHPVFRAEEGHDFNSGGLEEDVDGGVQVAVDAAGVGDYSYLLACELGEASIAEYFYSGFYLGRSCCCHSAAYNCYN